MSARQGCGSAEKTKAECPRREEHTPHPTGYLAHYDWAVDMLERGYRQRKCPGCGLYAIWEKP